MPALQHILSENSPSPTYPCSLPLANPARSRRDQRCQFSEKPSQQEARKIAITKPIFESPRHLDVFHPSQTASKPLKGKPTKIQLIPADQSSVCLEGAWVLNTGVMGDTSVSSYRLFIALRCLRS